MSSSDAEDVLDGSPQPDDVGEGESTSTDDGAPKTEETLEEKRKRAGPLRLKAAVALPILFLAAGLVYYFTIDGIIADQLTAAVESHAGEGGQAEVEYVSFSIFGPKLTVRELRGWQNTPDGEHEVVYLDEAVIDVEFWPLLERRLVVNELTATEIRYHDPIREEEEPEEADVPTDTSEKELNDYLKEIKEILESEEVQDLRDWLEKLREYIEKDEEKPEDEEPPIIEEEEEELGPAGRAWYVEEALKNEAAKPRVVVKKAGVSELAFTFGREDKNRFAHKVTDLLVEAESVSSDPIAYSVPMRFNAAGNLDGEASRRVEIGLTLRFDPDELISLEQVDGKAGFASLPIDSLVDPGVFGDTLHDASLSITHYSPTHGDFAGRTQIQVSGAIQPPGFPSAAKASFGIWLGGYRGADGLANFAPSGISVQIEDFPLGPVLDLAGGSPIPLRDKDATITFGTCTKDGVMAGPDAALTWHDGMKVHLRLKVNGLAFAEPQGELGGLPGQFVVRGLNRVIDDLGGLDVVVGFEGSKDRIALDLEKPGLRAFVDAIINTLTLTATDVRSMVDLPFQISSSTEFGLASVNADGSVRDPKWNLTGEARHDFNDLRVALNLRDVSISQKPGQSTIVGLPAADFTRAFNTFMGSLGDDGLSIRSRLMNAEGQFSPALESPGLRGLVDAMANVVTYTGQQINSNFNLPVNMSSNALVRLESVDENGSVRTISSPGADSSDLSNLRLRLVASNFTVSPKPGQNTVLGVPADQFSTAFNTFINAQGDKGLALDWKILDARGTFAPELKSPGTRGLFDGIVSTLKYNGTQLNQNFNLPFKIDPKATMTAASIEPDGKVRKLNGPDADSNDLNDLVVSVTLKNAYAEPKPGQSTILGVPADYFTFAWNKLQAAYAQQGFPMRMKLFDTKGKFAPQIIKPDETELLKQMGNMVGITDFKTAFAKIAQNFPEAFKAFNKDGLKVAEDIASGKMKFPNLPGDDDKKDEDKLPEIPDIPKLPWGK